VVAIRARKFRAVERAFTDMPDERAHGRGIVSGCDHVRHGEQAD
jgi:hypothetical protein